MPNVATSSSLDTSLKELLEGIGKGSIQLPEFQRGWTWDDLHIRAILASLTQGYPMGAVMRLQCGGDANFKARPFEGAGMPSMAPEFLVLDGQQRLTSIFRAAWARKPVETKTEKDQPIRRFYYLDIEKCLDANEDRFDAVVSVPEDRMIRKNFNRDVVLDLSSPEKEYEAGMFPLNIAFDSDAREDWADGYKDFHGGTQECKERYKKFRSEVLNVATAYKLPVITLSRETPKEAVCQVFEHVNTGGVSLTVFELVTASFAASDFDLRRDWAEVRPAIRGEGEMLATDVMAAVNEKDFLTAVTLYASHERRLLEGRDAGSSCKRKDVLALSLADYLKHRDAVIDGFRLARKFLLSQFIFRQRDLPYAAQLVPLAAICACAGPSLLGQPKAGAILARWYWCGVFGEMYGGTTDTIFANDMDDVPRAMKAAAEGKEPVPVRTADAAFFSAPRLLTMRSRNSAAYKGVMALIWKAGGLDFRNGTSMNAVCAMEEAPDIHHIFPKRWCLDSGDPDVLAKMDSIVNKTPLLPVSNRAIGGDAPSAYAQKILKDAGIDEKELRARVESHLVDWAAFKDGNFKAHFIARAKRLLNLIEGAMGKEVADRGSAQTVERFGASLEDDAPEGEPGPAPTAPGALQAEGSGNVAPPKEASVGEEVERELAPADGGTAEQPEGATEVPWQIHEKELATKAGPDVSGLYPALRTRLCSFGDVAADPRSRYVSFKTAWVPFLSVVIRYDRLKLIFNARLGDLDDPRGMLKPNREHLGPGEVYADLVSQEELDAVLHMARQSFEAARARAGAESGKSQEAVPATPLTQGAAMDEEEAVRLWPAVEEFVKAVGREPSSASADASERRLAEALDFMRDLKAKKMLEKQESRTAGGGGAEAPSPDVERMLETILLGLAVGDATGVPFEFLQRGTFKAEPMQGGGAHGQPAGTWSDDTALALAFADSLRSGGFDAEQAGRNFQDWLYKAEFTARGEVFDVGSATRTAILRMRQGVQPEQAGGTGEYDNGNGSLMRIAPIVPALLDVKEPEARYKAVRRASSLTHAHPLACACCFVFAEYLRLLSLGWDRDTGYRRLCADFADGFPFIEGEVLAKLGRVLDGGLPFIPEPEIQSGGFVLHTLEAALWCLLNSDSYEETVLKAVGLGRDADTTACVAGAVAAACWGRDSIPEEWVNGLAGRDELLRIARKAAEQIRSGGTGMKQ